ncbi:MAG: hypothetical protein E7148_03905 [Rikenellaceae bacterium]|nr:hypothetical protein [Rikenellaceae bacterium]
MEENKNGYDPSQYEEEDYAPTQGGNERSMRGYRIVIIILSVILVALSMLYFSIHKQQMLDNQLLQADRDSIQNDLGRLMVEYDSLRFQNDSIAANLARANEVMEQLKRERRWNYNKIKQYEKEVGTLRTLMKGYIRQIDSLNTINKKVIKENVSLRKEVSTANQRADMAEEKAAELDNKIRIGSVIKARNIRLVALNKKSKQVSRIKNATRLRVDFVLSANELTTPGNKAVYVRIFSPDNYMLTTEAMPAFEFEGNQISYSAMREVDYQNQDLEVGIFYNSSGFVAGTYKIELYCDGHMIGETQIAMR